MDEQGPEDSAGAGDTQKTSPGKKLSAGTQVSRDLIKGLLFAVLMVAIKLGVEHTGLGERIDLMGYDLLQRQLSSEKVPVYIVDISDLEATSFNIDGKTGVATPREPLRQLIEAIAKQEPRAIGIDIDFSPDKDGYITPRDTEFFQSCFESGVPVFLGIRRTEMLPPQAWLGGEGYQTLAANITIPKDDNRRMPKWFRTDFEGFPEGRTMSAALAGAFGESHCPSGELLERMGLAEQISEKKLGREGRVGVFLVDYSPLDNLMTHETLRTKSPEVVRDQGRLLRNKIVLLGDGTLGKATDTFVVPGRSEPVPGVYLHACAAYTLAKAPLYELTGLGRVGIDFLLSALILLAIAGIRLYYKGRTSRDVATHRLQGLFTVLVVIASMMVGVLFVRRTCVMWSDFILVVFVLLLHPSIERQMEGFWRRIRKIAPPIVRDFIFERKEGSQ